LQINQQIEQAQLAYENAQNTFETAKRSTELSAKNAEINVSSADVGIDTLKNNFSAAKKVTINYLDTVIDTADKLL
jgi:outer membrane protein TolC